MLTWLQVKNFAIADHVELDFHSGLSVITGETGAGKSIIINALAIVLGQRAESNIVKHGKPRAEIQANFDITNNKTVQTLLHELELDDEDQECQLRRIIHTKSGNKAYINGRMVTASTLRNIGQHLLDIHGQHEHQSLLRTDTQRQLLDQYAGINQAVITLGDCYKTLVETSKQLQKIREDSASAQQKLEFLQFQTEELTQFSPQENEWGQLNERHQRIHHQAELTSALLSVEQSLFGGDPNTTNASMQLSTALHALEKAQLIAPELKQTSDILLEAQTLIQESETSLRQVSENASLDESELLAIEQRFTAHMDLARKHRVEPDKLYDTHLALMSQLELASNPEKNEQVLLDIINTEIKRYVKQATLISKQRNKHAKQLSKAITKSMQTLAMEGGIFDISLQAVNATVNTNNLGDFPGIGNQTGMENISFDVSTNAGMPKLKLAKVASGGELSRISLAMQLILSDIATVNTLVFDEVDVGVGGKTAAIIGKMLAQLADTKQIICITHLPQVASFGTDHFVVSKHQGEKVQLSITALNEDEKIAEIARMVGGETLTKESIAHARTLIKASEF